MQTITTQIPPKKLLDQVRDKLRFKHYSLSTENTYISESKGLDNIEFKRQKILAKIGGLGFAF